MMRKKPKPPAAAGPPTAAPSCADATAEPVRFTHALAVLFQQHLHPSTGVSRHTIDSYKTTFRLLLQFLRTRRPELLLPDTAVERFEAPVLDSFLRHLSEDRGCSGASVNVRRAAFAALARSLLIHYPHLSAYCHSIAAIPSRKTCETLVGYFELHELDAIFAGIDTSHKDGFRDMAILRLLYNTGARASELCGLQLSDLRLSEPPHVVLRGKRGKVRTVPLWPATADLLRAYLTGARRSPRPGHEAFVFIGRRGNALSRQGLYKLARTHINNAARKLPQLRRAELHPVCSFRHTTATHLVMAGVSLPEVQNLLGHARPETTMRYRALSLEHKRHALERLLSLRSHSCGGASPNAASVPPQPTDSQESLDWLERL
jgi:site-specific recombinase XerD